MKYLRIINNMLAKVEHVFIIIILSTMILLAFLQVILRNFFATSLFWGDTVLRHLVVWIGFFGASLATKEGKHINIDVLSRIFNPKVRHLSQIVVNAFASLVCYFLMQASISFIRMEQESESILFSGLPAWIAQVIIAIGFGIMMFRFFIHAMDHGITLFATGHKENA